jgi:hypothetical protein
MTCADALSNSPGVQVKLRTSVSLLATVVAWVASTPARADDQVCNDAYEQGQVLRKDAKLLEAREMLRACVNACKADSKKNACVEWLAQAEHDIPTVVFSAKDAAGVVLVDVVVSMDSKALVATLDGRSVEVNPGVHTFSFQLLDGTNKKEIQVVAEQGKKDTPVAVTMGVSPPLLPSGKSPEAAHAASTPPSVVPAVPTGALSEAEPPTGRSAAPWKAAGVVTLGAGVVALGVGTVFGMQAISKKSDAGCDSKSTCPNGSALDKLHDAHGAGDLSTIFFVAGGVLAGAGITMWALAPTMSVQVAPSVGQNTAGMTLRGTW